MELVVRITGDISIIRQLIDAFTPTLYMTAKNANGTWSLFLEEEPPYKNLYENILHFQSVRFTFPSFE
jgi:hypothetical protein